MCIRDRSDAEMRGIKDQTLVLLRSRKGETTLKAYITEKIPPGVVYTTFHNPETGANVVTTETVTGPQIVLNTKSQLLR